MLYIYITTVIPFNKTYKRRRNHYVMNLMVHVRIFTMLMNTKTYFNEFPFFIHNFILK